MCQICADLHRETTNSFCVAKPTQMLCWTEPATDPLGFWWGNNLRPVGTQG